MQAFLIEHHHRKDRLIQEFIDAPLEVGVFYMRSASENKGRISGIVQKEFLFVVGDGHLTLQQLIHQHPRARYHETMLEKEFSTEWSRILELGERLEIVEIGTHSR